MAKTKNRVTSVLLVLCMVMVMLAGMLIAAPVQVKAAISGIASVDFNGVSSWNGDSILHIAFLGNGYGTSAGKVLTISDGSNTWTFLEPGRTYESPTISRSITHSLFSPPFSYDPTATYTLTIEAGTFLESDNSTILPWNVNDVHFTVAPTPTPAPDAGTGEYYDRHYNFWNGVHAQLSALGNSGSVTVNTEGHSLDMVMHFTFDALNNTNRTLIIKHQGSTYTIRGKAESADHVWMGGILLGNNHSFSILGAYRK